MSLLHSSTPPLLTVTERRPAAYKVLKRGQVFIILNLQINDAGKYSCVATNKANQTIQWPPGAGFFVLSRGKLEIKLIKCRIKFSESSFWLFVSKRERYHLLFQAKRRKSLVLYCN